MKGFNLEETEEPKNMEKYCFGQWPGVVKGCFCRKNYGNIYTQGSCSKEDLDNDCLNVKDQGPLNIYNYYFKFFIKIINIFYLN
jgi:hypothetical protein